MKILSLLLMLTVAFCSSGCVAILAGAAGGAGTAYWMSNKLGQDVNGSADQVVKAVQDGLAELKLSVIKETRELGIVQLRSVYDDQEPVWVDIRSLSPKTCRLEVRVGFGNKEATRKVFDAIMKKL